MRVLTPSRGSSRFGVALLAVGLTVGGVASMVSPAQAASSVTVANPAGAAVADPTYATRMTVSGRGFQSVKGGRGGIYVAFGTVKSGWQPSRGGITGRDYFYVPDTESGKNHGYQKYVAFPGSSTSGEANGGTISADGSWSTTVTVPGATFRAADRNGRITTIDCAKVTCGIITLGAHGLKNARNETFTPIRFVAGTTQTGQSTPPGGNTTGQGATGGATEQPADPTAGLAPATGPTGKPRLKVDHSSARAGAALSFTAAGLTPGKQVTVVLDDGAAAAGPFLVGPDGTFAGVIQVPTTIGGGTHELRVFGMKKAPTLNFAVAPAADSESTPETPQAVAATTDRTERNIAIGVTVLAGILVLGALARLLRARRRSVRHA